MRVLLTILLSVFVFSGAFAQAKTQKKTVAVAKKGHATAHKGKKKPATHHKAHHTTPVPEFVKTDTLIPNTGVNYLLTVLKENLGKPYRMGSNGSNGPSGFDCSGLLQYAFSFVGIDLPRASYDIGKLGEKITMGDLQPGDLLFFYGRNNSPKAKKRQQIGHVGCVYKVDGDKVYMIHSSEEGVNIVDVNNVAYYKDRLISARRINSLSNDSGRYFAPRPKK